MTVLCKHVRQITHLFSSYHWDCQLDANHPIKRRTFIKHTINFYYLCHVDMDNESKINIRFFSLSLSKYFASVSFCKHIYFLFTWNHNSLDQSRAYLKVSILATHRYKVTAQSSKSFLHMEKTTNEKKKSNNGPKLSTETVAKRKVNENVSDFTWWNYIHLHNGTPSGDCLDYE